MDNRAIGYMDSGVGGLTVVKQALNQLPNEQVIYVGDTARMPYGPREQAEVKAFSWQLANFLVAQDIKLLVVACNTATAAALPDLQKNLPIPVVGVIQPGIDAALALPGKHVGVIATEGTVKSMAYANGLTTGNSDKEVVQLAAPEFVTAVEKLDYHAPVVAKLVAERLAFFNNQPVDTLIMGCTHFPLLEGFIQAAMGDKVHLINAGAESIKVVEKIMAKNDLAHDVNEPLAANRFYTTGAVDEFTKIAQSWLADSQLSVQGLAINADELVVR
ncbi:glutamate racemase [Weissella oryzae SG25]|uniref:Glutamate racemase n=1 Tax=Weissella oryzae (strain DSM 25784 / JCM 18191 / LMG 30913 / SG25) TaxID=1329250 RepID=A0A069D1P2_WEIOS|nr:glutamate racemase [Weissella oryzae SG25]